MDTVVLDKTGTVTEGKPRVTDVLCGDSSGKELLSVAASLESRSSHPLAEPILQEAYREGADIREVQEYRMIPGQGIAGKLDGQDCYAGNRRLMQALGISAENSYRGQRPDRRSHPAAGGTGDGDCRRTAPG